MKLLHAADLHLGRSFRERPLLDDQRAMLDGLLAALAADDYAALLLAGDIYDRSIPGPEAVELLGRFLAETRRRFPDLTIVACAGNHDSPERLAYGDELFSALGIHIVCDPARCFRPIWVERAGERWAMFALPFLVPGSLAAASTDAAAADGEGGAAGPAGADCSAAEAAGAPLRSQRDLARAAAARLESARAEAALAGADGTALLAHLFASGGAESESERSFLGTAERVDPALFAGFDYVALGHLHRFQKAAPNAWYSGSPLAYSFDEAGAAKGFAAVELKAGEEPSVRLLPFDPPRRVTRLSGDFASFMEAGAYPEHREDYLEIALDDGHLVENPLAILRTRYPQLLSVRQDRALEASFPADGAGFGPARARRNAVDDFAEFLRELYGKDDAEKLGLFKAIAEELSDETA